MSDHATTSVENRVPQETLMERILDRSNIQQAWNRVRSNKGAPGGDKMTIAEFRRLRRRTCPG